MRFSRVYFNSCHPGDDTDRKREYCYVCKLLEEAEGQAFTSGRRAQNANEFRFIIIIIIIIIIRVFKLNFSGPCDFYVTRRRRVKLILIQIKLTASV